MTLALLNIIIFVIIIIECDCFDCVGSLTSCKWQSTSNQNLLKLSIYNELIIDNCSFFVFWLLFWRISQEFMIGVHKSVNTCSLYVNYSFKNCVCDQYQIHFSRFLICAADLNSIKKTSGKKIKVQPLIRTNYTLTHTFYYHEQKKITLEGTWSCPIFFFSFFQLTLMILCLVMLAAYTRRLSAKISNLQKNFEVIQAPRFIFDNKQ